MSTFSRLALSLLVMLSVTGCSAFGLFGDDDSTAQKKAFDTFQSEAELDILWSTSVGDGLGNKYHQFAPAVIGESVFALAAEGVVEALNKGDGQTIWQTDVAEVITSGVGAGFGQVFVASESGKLYALSATSGEQVWVKQLSTEVVAPPQVNSEIVVIQQINGQVVALDRKTGEQRWVYDTVIPRLTLRGTSTPIVTEAVTLASFANGKLAVIRNDNGKQIWERRVVNPTGSSELERIVDFDGKPLLVGNTLYLASYQGRILAVNLNNAQIAWSQKYSSIKSVAGGFGNIYAVSDNGFVEAFTQKEGAIVWRQEELAGVSLTAPVAIESYVAVGDTDGFIHVLSQVDGQVVSRIKPSNDSYTGELVAVDGVLYAQDDSGTLRAIRLN